MKNKIGAADTPMSVLVNIKDPNARDISGNQWNSSFAFNAR